MAATTATTDSSSKLFERPFTASEGGSRGLTLMQFNTLAQCCSYQGDIGFPAVDASLLTWEGRWPLLEAELVRAVSRGVDVICLEEVDRFDEYSKLLSTYGFVGEEVCRKGHDHNNPSIVMAMACFWKPHEHATSGSNTTVSEKKSVSGRGKLEFIDKTVLSATAVYQFRYHGVASSGSTSTNDPQTVCVVLGHLKAKVGEAQTAIRLEQSAETLKAVQALQPPPKYCFVCADMNDVPESPVLAAYQTPVPKTEWSRPLTSAYGVPDYTTCKFREKEGGLVCRTIDYILFDAKTARVTETMLIPPIGALPPIGLPCEQYGSDHFSLMASFELL